MHRNPESEPFPTLTRVPGFRVGHAQVPGGGSGCTVILGPVRGAVEVRGMATGTREMDVLSSQHLVGRADAVLLTGGSAFGLAAADGVMEWMETRGLGFDTGVARVPIVPACVIFDLRPGVARPGPVQGREACEAASRDPVGEGRVGAGAGATIGKAAGRAGRSSPGGVGSIARPWGEHWVGGLAVVNALGDVVGRDGTVLAGARDEKGAFLETDAVLLEGQAPAAFGRAVPPPGTNTTLVVVGTDLPLSRTDLSRLAGMAAAAFPRAISPVNTPFDGDVLLALSSGAEAPDLAPGDLLALGVLARIVAEESIRRAVGAPGGDPRATRDPTPVESL